MLIFDFGVPEQVKKADFVMFSGGIDRERWREIS